MTVSTPAWMDVRTAMLSNRPSLACTAVCQRLVEYGVYDGEVDESTPMLYPEREIVRLQQECNLRPTGTYSDALHRMLFD